MNRIYIGIKTALFYIILVLLQSCAMFYAKQKLEVDPKEHKHQHTSHCSGYESDSNTHFKVLATGTDSNFIKATRQAEASAIKQLEEKVNSYLNNKGKSLTKEEVLSIVSHYKNACHATHKVDSVNFTHYIGAELDKSLVK